MESVLETDSFVFEDPLGKYGASLRILGLHNSSKPEAYRDDICEMLMSWKRDLIQEEFNRSQ